VRVWWLRADLESPDPAVQTRALYEVAARHEARAGEAVLAVLAEAEDRGVVDAARAAALRTGDWRGVAVLRRRADDGPDDSVRAKLIATAARLSNRDVRLSEWLDAGAASTEPWRRVGSAWGLLEIGRPRGGALLIDMMPELPAEAGRLAWTELRRIAEPMTQAVGWPIEWPAGEGRLRVHPKTLKTDRLEACPTRVPGRTLSEAGWASLREFWSRHATVQLLGDVLTRLEQRDPKWHQVDRLLRARDRIATWF
jgi:hypothetical protein